MSRWFPKAVRWSAGLCFTLLCAAVAIYAFTFLFDALKPTGVLVVVSIWGHPGTLDMQKLVLKEIDMRGTIAYVNNHAETIALVESGTVDLAPFITGRIGLDDLVTVGYDTLLHHNETAVKILVSPSGAGL